MNRMRHITSLAVALVVGFGLRAWSDEPIRRTNNKSPTFYVSEADVGYFMNYTGYRYHDPERTKGERFFEAGIGPKILDMIDSAEHWIIMSVFLFDSFYTEQEPERDIVGALHDAFLQKRKDDPDIRIALILDPSHKAYGQRVSPVEKSLRENGIDVFYSDLISGLKKASLLGIRETLGHGNRIVNRLTFNGWGNFWSRLSSLVVLPKKFDNERLSLESAYNAFLLKANHRKLFVTDIHGREFEALVTSANPHNASAFHVNSAVSVRGEPAKYIFNVLRKDMMKSAKLGRRYSHWHDAADRQYKKHYFRDRFPSMDLETIGSTVAKDERNVGVTFVSEGKIPGAIIDMLKNVQSGDQVRIQMFYLSFQPVLDAILRACRITTETPIRLLLDANKDSFNKEKDGTPNRQVSRYLLREAERSGGRLEVRWYSTHGEQNHAKTMSITNSKSGKHQLTTGSCNWTGRNMDGVNMEANIIIDGSLHVAKSFNTFFDLFWTNGDGNEYSLDYETFQDAAPDWKWKKGEKPLYLSTF